MHDKGIIIARFLEFMNNEARSCSRDFGCVAPLFAYRMFGGLYSMEELKTGIGI